MIKNNFINELDNKIKIKIKNKKDIGVNSKTKEKINFKGVSISIKGPTSESENIITMKEAKELYKTLGLYLKSLKE